MLRTVSAWLCIAFAFVAYSTEASATLQEKSADLIEAQLSLWFQRGRPDRAQPYLEQMLRVDPANPLLLEASFLLHIQQKEHEKARTILNQLQSLAPRHSATLRAVEIMHLETNASELIGQARLLYLAGRYDASAQTYMDAFPRPPVQTNQAIDYWQARGRAGEGELAVQQLSQLHEQHPNNGFLEIAVYRMHYFNESLTARHLFALNELTADAVFGQEALGLWQRILATLAVTQEHFTALAALSQRHPENREIAAHYRRFEQALASERTRLANPFYQRYLQGVSALGSAQPEWAESLLLEAMGGLEPFGALYGNLGYATMRQGKHDEALLWFSRATQLETDVDEWQEMLDVAQFWSQLGKVDDALASEHLDEAGRLLAELPPDLEVSLRQGRLASLRGDFYQAIHLYDSVLDIQPMNEQALWGALINRRAAYGAELDLVLNWVDRLAEPQQQVIKDEVARVRALVYTAKGDTAYDQNRYDEAMAHWQKARRFLPQDPWLLFRVAREYDRQSQHERAITLFGEVTKGAKTPDYYYALALTFARQNDFKQSLQTLQKINLDDRTDAMEALFLRSKNEIQLSMIAENGIQNSAAELEWLYNTDVETQIRALNLAAEQMNDDQAWLTEVLSDLLTQRSGTETPAQSSALFFAASRVAQSIGDNRNAAIWSQAGLEHQMSSGGGSIWQSGASDDWQISSARSRLLNTAQASETRVSVGWRTDTNSGTPGISEWNANTLMIEIERPVNQNNARWHFRIDPTWVSAGSFDADDNFWRNRLGTGLFCTTIQCDVDGQQKEFKEFGIALGVGRSGQDYTFDLGLTPVGFTLPTWVGGIERRGNLASLGWRLGAERRAVSSNFLSFVGYEDLFSERRWGAVTRNGVNGSLSRDQGGLLGWWGVAGIDYYTGHNVASNWRWYAHNGVYLRAFDTEPFALTIGLTNLNWGFDKTLSRYTFGHGGYYSPAQYNSVSLPITVFGRSNRLSYSLRLAAGYSSARQRDEIFFPNSPDMQERAEGLFEETGLAPFYDGSKSSGINYGASLNAEFRLTRRWYIGANFSVQRSDTFTPNNGAIYIRYQSGSFALPPRRPPQSMLPYVDY